MNVNFPKKRVLFLTNLPSPYRVDFFNELGKSVLLTVAFEKRRSDERNGVWDNLKFVNFKGVVLKGIKTRVDQAFSPGIIHILKKSSFDFVVNTCLTPTGVLAAFWCKLRGIPYYFELDGGTPKNGKGLKEKLKRFVVKNAVGCFGTNLSCDQFFMFYGASPDNIRRYPFTSLFQKDLISKPLSDEEKQKIRQRLGISSKQVILSVGRVVYGKGFDVLLETQKKLDDRYGLYIVGGNPTVEILETIEKFQLKNVRFIGFKNKEDLKFYYQVADVFVFPTRGDVWGLVVNEAMANACPVVSTDKSGAAIELVEEGKNGYIVPADDAESLAIKIDRILSDDSLRSDMARRSLEKISNYTVEKMAETHLDVFSEKRV